MYHSIVIYVNCSSCCITMRETAIYTLQRKDFSVSQKHVAAETKQQLIFTNLKLCTMFQCC